MASSRDRLYHPLRRVAAAHFAVIGVSLALSIMVMVVVMVMVVMPKMVVVDDENRTTISLRPEYNANFNANANSNANANANANARTNPIAVTKEQDSDRHHPDGNRNYLQDDYKHHPVGGTETTSTGGNINNSNSNNNNNNNSNSNSNNNKQEPETSGGNRTNRTDGETQTGNDFGGDRSSLSTLEDVWSHLKLLVPTRGSNGYFQPEPIIVADFERIVFDMMMIGHGCRRDEDSDHWREQEYDDQNENEEEKDRNNNNNNNDYNDNTDHSSPRSRSRSPSQTSCDRIDLRSLEGKYRTRTLVDADNGRAYCILATTSANYPWGNVVVDLDPSTARNLSFDCPHPLFDAETAEQGLRLLKGTTARSWIVAGSHRMATPMPTPMETPMAMTMTVANDPETQTQTAAPTSASVCQPPHSASDAAHSAPSCFLAAVAAIRSYYDSVARKDYTAVQLHGMGSKTCGSVDTFFSHGSCSLKVAATATAGGNGNGKDSDNGNGNGNGNGMAESSALRRQMLQAMLAASAGSTLFPSPKAANAEPVLEKVSTGAAAIPDWSGIKVVIPPSDDREYLVEVLENGLRVVLCSDPTSNEAGAAMDVHVGACSDPLDIPGLAHFNEHMLFLGTKEYPNENSFEEFLSANGGSSNAYTASESTCYYFTQQAEADEKLAEGLKRFGSFFTSPLFTEAATGRELNAIESENSKNLQTDSFRLYQINKERQNKDHPHSKFFTGNKKTLLDDTKKKGIDLRQSLIEFYEKHYSADQMTLAIVGPQSLDTLKKMAHDSFANIPNRNAGAPEKEWMGVVPPFDPNNSVIPSFGNVVKIVPVSDLRQVSIAWPIPYKDEQDRQSALLTKQAQYVGHIIGHEGPGSLLSYLKNKGWVNSLSAGGGENLSDFETFDVTATLTKSGLEKVDQVVEAIYATISMIRSRPVPKYIFNEVLQLEELGWRFSSKGSVSNYLQSLSNSLQDYPPSLCVAGPRRLALRQDDATTLLASNAARTAFDSTAQLDYTRKLASDFVDNLTVDNAMYTIISKSYKGDTNQKEYWYGTDYRVDAVPISTVLQWKNPTSVDDFGITFPRKNIFIPSENGLKLKFPPKPNVGKAPRSFEDRMAVVPPPRVIRDDGENGRWTVYYKADDTFGQPKAFVIFELLTKEVYSSAKAAALSNMYEFCVADHLTEYAYDAGLAGLTYDVQVIPRGVRLTFGGYNDKLEDFAKYVSKQITTDMKNILPKDEAEFDRYKDLQIRGFEGFNAKQPYAHCAYYTTLLMKPPGFEYDNKELLAATQEVTLADLESYVSSVWSSGKGIALVQGNVDQKQAQTLVSSIDKALDFKPISVEEFPPELAPLPLPESPASSKGTRLVISEPNAENGNAASYVSIQDLSEEPKEHVLMELIGNIVGERFYDELRTRQQLGYIVSSGVRAVGKTKSLGFIVQSSSAKNEKLTNEIMKYLDSIRPKYLETLGDADFAVYVKSMIDRKTEPDKQLATETTRNWAEISSGRMQFDRRQKEVAALLDLKKEDLVDFWDRIYVKDGRRVLITEMIPQVGPTAATKPALSTGYGSSTGSKLTEIVLGIDDIDAYRKDRSKLLA